MATARSTRGAVLAVIAVLVLGTAWIAVGDRGAVAPRTLSEQLGPAHRGSNDTISPIDVTDAVVTSLPAIPRSSELRLVSLWVLPGLAAALAALCALRQLRGSPTRPARRVFLRGSLARRAPPLASFA